MTPAQKVSLSRSELIMTQPFFGVLCLRLETLVDEAHKTAWTDGKRLGYNPKFIDKLTMPQCIGLVAHEVMHCALGHPWRVEGRNHRVWNIACDLLINHIVTSAKLELPPDGVTLKSLPFATPDWLEQSAEWVYARLMEQLGDGQPQLIALMGQAVGDGDGEGGEGDGEGGDQPWGEVKDAGCSETALEDQANWQVATVQAANAAKQQGKLPAALERMVEEINRPKVDWKAALRRFVQETAKNDYTWKRPSSRTLVHGLYLPSLRSETMPPMIVAVDTSGSIDQITLNAFASEIQSIMDEVKPEAVHVIYCDARVNRTEEYLMGDVIQLTPCGGGGTDHHPVFEWVEEEGLEPACLVALTDMYTSFPDDPPPYPVLWCSTSRGIQGPWGETLELEVH